MPADDYGDYISDGTRQSNDGLVNYRLKKMEDQHHATNESVTKIASDLTDLKLNISEQFADLKKTLFERPVFVTYELMKIELEGRDSAISQIKNDLATQNQSTITTRQHYTQIVLTLFVALVVPILLDRLLGTK